MGKSNYQLRPGKAVDRALFTELLLHLEISSGFRISRYRYIGFGALSFEEYKLLHKRLKIKDMISLEKSHETFLRQEFNKPYACIKLKELQAIDYIERASFTKDIVFWLDYTGAMKAERISEMKSLLDKYEAGSIFRVTFNADIRSLDDLSIPFRERVGNRLSVLRSRVGEHFVEDIVNEDLVQEKYPLVLLNIIKKVTTDLFLEQEKRLLPLSAYCYDDGSPMLTFTGIVLLKQNVAKIKSQLKGWPYLNMDWEAPHYISENELTVKEMLEIDRFLPEKIEKAIESFPKIMKDKETGGKFRKKLELYAKYYQYYPSYHQVIL